MNCENYRNAIAAAPTWEGGAEHLAECAACRSYRDEMRALDRRIAGALELDVPALIMPELDESNVVALKPRRVSMPAWFALAATVVVAAFLGIRMFGGDVTYPSLADEIVAHLDHEPYALRVTDETVSDRRLARVVPANIANMNHDAGLITYAQTCVINGKEVPHLVIQGRSGPVTVLLMPDEMVDGAQQIEGESINGVILPVGNGSIAIIGEEDERLDTIQESVMHSVSWST
jgi:hypothetical protein